MKETDIKIAFNHLRTLTSKNRAIVSNYYGLSDSLASFHPEVMEEIGKKYGMTRQNVSYVLVTFLNDVNEKIQEAKVLNPGTSPECEQVLPTETLVNTEEVS